MRLGDAWSILPSLAVDQRNEVLETARLQALACWAGNFTPEISLATPQTLLLEIAGSQRLFGGLPALFEQVRDGCVAQGHQCQAALAPTPRGALWLAMAAPGTCCPDIAGMRNELAALPVSVLALPAREAARIEGFGVRRLGDLFRLPRAGLSRRLGAAFTADLARALGELPDPQPRFVFPQRFRDRLELNARVEDAGRLLFAARRLLLALCGWLAARGCGLLACTLELEQAGWREGRKNQERRQGAGPRPGEPLRVELGFSELTRDPDRIGRVLRERLAHIRLDAPVHALSLHADAPAALPGRDGSLFGERQAESGVALLVERLQARMGVGQVYRVDVVPGHRPECASRALAPGLPSRGKPPPVQLLAPGHVSPQQLPPRPMWLLPQPQALPEVNGVPHRNGPLTLLAGPERLESGWWDAGEAAEAAEAASVPVAVGDIRRDYFIALSPHQEWLWIFRDVQGWFLHGLFS